MPRKSKTIVFEIWYQEAIIENYIMDYRNVLPWRRLRSERWGKTVAQIHTLPHQVCQRSSRDSTVWCDRNSEELQFWGVIVTYIINLEATMPYTPSTTSEEEESGFKEIQMSMRLYIANK